MLCVTPVEQLGLPNMCHYVFLYGRHSDSEMHIRSTVRQLFTDTGHQNKRCRLHLTLLSWAWMNKIVDPIVLFNINQLYEQILYIPQIW